MFPFSFWTSTAEFVSRLQITEAKLLEIAQRYSTRPADSWELKTFDTYIPRSAVPCLKPAKTDEEKTLKIHCVQVVSKEPINDLPENETTQTPLVNLHGYMNAGAYFYRNLGGLSSYFRNIYAVDMLGWGLSSRPSFNEVIESGTIKSAEDFFVESLEAWRSMVRVHNNIASTGVLLL
jgi:pimeloyl-ACP methyl ester carboxylesterase